MLSYHIQEAELSRRLITMISTASPDAGALTTNINELSLTSTPEASLLSLPRELRDEIFGYLLRAGSLEFLRTSTQIHDEAKEQWFHEAVFRVKMGFTGGRVNSFLKNWRKIERFHFHIFLGPGTSLPPRATFRRFDRFAHLDGMSLKRECLISIECNYHLADRRLHSHERLSYLYEKLACLKTFTTVVVEFVCHHGNSSADFREKARKWNKKYMMSDNLKRWEEKLKPGLGTGMLGSGNYEGEQLVFHPLEYHSTLAGKRADISVEE